MRVARVIFCSGFVLNAINRAILWQIVNKRLRGREAKQRVIEAAGRASIGKLGMTPKIKENIKTAVGTHSVSCDSAVYVSGRVGGQPVDMLVDTGSALTLIHCRLFEKAKTDFKLGMVSETAVSANGQPLDIKRKREFFLMGRVLFTQCW